MVTSQTISTTGGMPAVLQRLRDAKPAGGRFFSVYLDTEPARLIGQGHLVAFRAGCASLRVELADAPPAERQAFDAAVARVEDALAISATGAPGLALFDLDGEVLVTPLPIPPADQVAWGDTPSLLPLEEALDECERVAVLLLDKERARIFTVFLGQIEERAVIVDEVPGRQQTGGWFGLAQKRYDRHHEDLVLRHVKRSIRALMDELRQTPFDRLFIGGPDEARTMLASSLPGPLRNRLAGTLSLPLFASEGEVLAATLDAAAAAERREEMKAVASLIDEATTPHVALGRESTFAALHERRVHHLYVATRLDQDGNECARCGRLTTAFERCPACSGETRPVEIRERVIAEARAQGARVELVAGPAEAALMEHGGLAARTRY